MFLSNKPLDLYYIVIEDINNCIDFNIERLRGDLNLSVSDSEFILFQSLQGILRKLFKEYSIVVLSPQYKINIYCIDPSNIPSFNLFKNEGTMDYFEVSGVTSHIRDALKSFSTLKRIDNLYKKRSLKQLIDIENNEGAIKTFIHHL